MLKAVCVCHPLFQRVFRKQGATGVPEERWPTKTSFGTPVNVPAFLIYNII